jgi:hypothetical protein
MRMSKTFSASDVGERWQDIVDEARTNGATFVKTEDGGDVVVVPVERWAKMNGDSFDDAMAKLRTEWDEQLAVLKEPGAGEKLQELMSTVTPEEIAEAANAETRRRR